MPKEYYREARNEGSSDEGLHHLRVHKSHNGGHLVEHYHSRSGIVGVNPQEHHVFSADEGTKVLAHIAKHMDISEQEEQEPASQGKARMAG